jgi:hypothetical protein
MVEIVNGNGAKLAFSSLGNSQCGVQAVASTSASSLNRFAAIFAKFRTGLRETCSEATNPQRCRDRRAEANWLCT